MVVGSQHMSFGLKMNGGDFMIYLILIAIILIVIFILNVLGIKIVEFKVSKSFKYKLINLKYVAKNEPSYFIKQYGIINVNIPMYSRRINETKNYRYYHVSNKVEAR